MFPTKVQEIFLQNSIMGSLSFTFMLHFQCVGTWFLQKCKKILFVGSLSFTFMLHSTLCDWLIWVKVLQDLLHCQQSLSHPVVIIIFKAPFYTPHNIFSPA